MVLNTLRVTILSICALVSFASTGIKTSMDISVIEQAKDQYFDEIVKLINSLTLPDLEDGKGNYLRDNIFTLEERTEKVVFSTDSENNAVHLKCAKLSAMFRSEHFRYKETIFVAKGHAEVDINTIDVEFSLKFNVTTLPDGRSIPYISAIDVKTEVDRFDINIKLFGNIWTDLASAFEVFFVGTVAGLIEDTITLTLDQGIPLVANTVLTKLDGYFPVPLIPNWVIDWETDEAAQVSDISFAIGTKAMMFDKRIVPHEEPDFEPPAMPYHSDTHFDKLQAFVSSYSIDAFFNSLLEIHPIQGWIRASELETLGAPVPTTTLLNVLLPGIVSQYGADMPVDIFFRMQKIGDIEIIEKKSEMGAYFTMDLEFWVNQADGSLDLATNMTLQDSEFKFSAIIDDMSLTLNIAKINVDKVVVNSCSFGRLSALTLKVELNNGFRIALPLINKSLLGQPINLPTHIGGLFVLKSLNLDYFDDYIYAGVTPIFVGPTPSEDTLMLQIE